MGLVRWWMREAMDQYFYFQFANLSSICHRVFCALCSFSATVLSAAVCTVVEPAVEACLMCGARALMLNQKDDDSLK